MKRGIALAAVVGLLVSMAVPVSAAEEIHTYKGDQELILTEAGDVDITKEELVEKSQNTMEAADNFAFFMKMDVEANMSYDAEGTQMSMDMAIKADMSDNKNGGLEYSLEKMTMDFFGMTMEQTSEEYIFPNASGKKVSVKKETSSETEEEESPEWVAEAVEEESEEALEETAGEIEALEEGTSADSMLTDDLFASFELLDKKYTDGEKVYYVLKGKTSEIMNSGFGDVEEMFGDITSDTDCYMLLSEEGMLESMYIDLGDVDMNIVEEEGVETTFSKFVISLYTDESTEIVIPEEVQAAGDAAA